LKVGRTDGKILLPGWWLINALNTADVTADNRDIHIADDLLGLIILKNWPLNPSADPV
jgi:hypothetical protein